MGRETTIKESILYEIWKCQNFSHPLSTPDGEEIAVMNPGNFNDESAGPDFKNAKIRIGNLTFIGDIEIDNSFSDWKSHGHHFDIKYNKVVLHVSLKNSSGYSHVYTRDGRKIPSIRLSKFIDEKVLNTIPIENYENDNNQKTIFKCQNINSDNLSEVKEKFLYALGVERFEKKCKKIHNRLKELEFVRELNLSEPIITYDLSEKFHEKEYTHNDFKDALIWKQLMYELVFEALGYSQNKVQMTDLAKNANLNFILKIPKDGIIYEKYESVLFAISGMLQNVKSVSEEETKKYVEKMHINWNSLRSFYDGKLMEETDWNFFRLRPQNFPTIRIAGGARFIYDLLHHDLISLLIKKISEIHNISVLINSLRSVFIIKADNYWKSHFVFDQKSKTEIKYFVGVSRADEIIVNVVLPFFAVYFEIFGNKNLAKKVFKIYSQFEQKIENQIITNVSSVLSMEESAKKTITAQGMIELFRNWCSKSKCLECEIGKTVFS